MKTCVTEETSPLHSDPYVSPHPIPIYKVLNKTVGSPTWSQMTLVPVVQRSLTICLLVMMLIVVISLQIINIKRQKMLEEDVKFLVGKIEILQSQWDQCNPSKISSLRKVRDLTYMGIPVYDSSYRKATDSSSEGLRIYEDWVTGNGRNPQSNEVTWETSVPPLMYTRKRVTTDKNNKKPSYRKSRVKYKDSNSYPDYTAFTQPLTTTAESVLDVTGTPLESLLAPSSEISQVKERRMLGSPTRHKGRRRKEKLLSDEAKFLFGSKVPPAIHLEGDTSNYTVGVNNNYLGNGRLRNVEARFTHWKPSWSFGSLRYADGIVRISEPGIYYVYAQVHYVDKHDTSGYGIYVNDVAVARCTIMARGHHSNPKSNTCYTGSLVVAAEGDKVFVADLEMHRYSVMRDAHSFFGMIKLGDRPSKVPGSFEMMGLY